MDVFTAMKERRSCRNYSDEPVSEEAVARILEAATWAPSPLNTQPWEFIVVTNQGLKEKIFSEADRCRSWAMEASGWKWLGKYRADFLKSAPVIIAVIGDPSGSGVDMFQEEGGVGYQHACAAAIQNMHLAAHALGLGTLWFTFFDRGAMREILGVPAEKTPLALICLGKPGGDPQPMPRKDPKEKSSYLR
ncbi:MAG: nitroreductase family protein [Deltaproteobacteria bacterium]|nr:nitroreductase family protein [Deltaproteobacteria bacterium]